MEHESDDNAICNWCFWSNHKKALEDLEITGRVETIQTAAFFFFFFRSARILKRILETCGDLLHSNSSEKPSANAGVKNSQKRTNNNNNNNNDSHKLLWNFNIQTDHLIPARRPDLIIIKPKEKENLQNCRLCCSAEHRINLKENEKKDKYLDHARELKKLWNMKVTIVPIALGTITIGLLKCLEDFEVDGRVEIIQTTALQRTARILRRVLEN